MELLIFPFFAICNLVLFIWGLGLLKSKVPPATIIVLLLTAGLVYDNTIIAVGKMLGAGGWLETLSHGRFLIHSTITPMLLLVALSFLQQAGVQWANKVLTFRLAIALTVFFIVLNLVGDFFRVFKIVDNSDSLRYATDLKITPSWVNPINIAILSLLTISLLVAGGILWRKTGWAWLFVTALITFVVSAATPSLSIGYILSNASEIVLMVGLVSTAYRLQTVMPVALRLKYNTEVVKAV